MYSYTHGLHGSTLTLLQLCISFYYYDCYCYYRWWWCVISFRPCVYSVRSLRSLVSTYKWPTTTKNPFMCQSKQNICVSYMLLLLLLLSPVHAQSKYTRQRFYIYKMCRKIANTHGHRICDRKKSRVFMLLLSVVCLYWTSTAFVCAFWHRWPRVLLCCSMVASSTIRLWHTWTTNPTDARCNSQQFLLIFSVVSVSLYRSQSIALIVSVSPSLSVCIGFGFSCFVCPHSFTCLLLALVVVAAAAVCMIATMVVVAVAVTVTATTADTVISSLIHSFIHRTYSPTFAQHAHTHIQHSIHVV